MAVSKQSESVEILLESVVAAPDKLGLSGHYIENRDPDRAIEALFLVASGRSEMEASEITKLDRSCIRGLRERHKDALTVIKRTNATKAALSASKALDLGLRKLAIMDKDPDALAKTSLKDIGIFAAISIDKAAQLIGDPTAVIEHRSGPSLDDYRNAIRAAKGRIVDIKPASLPENSDES